MKLKKRINSDNHKEMFYLYIYPLFAKEFLLGNNYENFAQLVSEVFILTSEQWDCVLEEWNTKEFILINVLCVFLNQLVMTSFTIANPMEKVLLNTQTSNPLVVSAYVKTR